MADFISLKGRRFGRWKVVKRAHNKGRKVAWVCVCQCGAKGTVLSFSLTSGHSTSCGCYRVERLRSHPQIVKSTDPDVLRKRRLRLNFMAYVRHLMKKYDVFVRMLREQHGRCAICNRRMTKPNVDHCHRTNKVRQLLCSFCNRLLGDAKENTAILKAAINYLRRHQ